MILRTFALFDYPHIKQSTLRWHQESVLAYLSLKPRGLFSNKRKNSLDIEVELWVYIA
jgi:hypothetical protein